MTTVEALSELFTAAGNQYGFDGSEFTVLRGKDMQQPALFGSMPPQPPQPDPLTVRERAMQAAYTAAGERFRECFESFVIRYLERHATGDGESIREAYERTSNPRPAKGHWQCVGGIYARLRKRGVIVEVGKVRSKRFGNDIAVIALVKNA